MKTNILDNEPLTPGICEWCGSLCELDDAACSLSCEAQLHRLEALQGRAVLRALKRWRKHRGRKGTPGEGQITEVASLIDRFLRTDRQRREAAQLSKRAKESKTDLAPSSPAKMETSAPVTEEPADWRSDGTKTEEEHNG